MAKLYNTIYVANPHDLKRLKLFKDTEAKILSADTKFIIWNNEEQPDDDGIYSWDQMYDGTTVLAMDTIQPRVIENLYKSDALFLYVDNICKNITALEVTYASALGIPCYLIINNRGNTSTYNMDMKTGVTTKIQPNADIRESHWCIEGLPNVYTYSADSLKHSQDTVNKILSIESPIEAMLLHEIFNQHRMGYYTLRGIEPQYAVDKYRIDFAYPEYKLAVELDGHDYHKTKEQRSRDAKRDRKLNSIGWEVMRFTGSEIFKNAYECLDEINCRIYSKEDYK